MTNGEAINWIINISSDLGKAEHRDLWHYEQALSEIREMLESAQQWIPASEPPKETNFYWATVIDYDTKEPTVAQRWYYGEEDENEWESGFAEPVLAWMPIEWPEPYKGEKDE